MKITIIGISDSFPHFKIGQEINASIRYVGDKMHELMIDETKHIMEINKTVVVDNKTLQIEAFITDNKNVGRIGLQIQYQ